MGFVLLKLVAGIAAFKLLYTWAIFRFLSRDPRADEIHFVTTGDGWQIRLCRYRSKSNGGEPVLLCHGAFGNQFNVASPDGDALVDVLTERGLDCWAIDFRGTRSSLAPHRMSRVEVKVDDFLLKDIPAAIEYVCDATGHPQVHWAGHSLGGMLMYAYELIHGRDRLASGASMGTPPGFEGVRLSNPAHLVTFVSKFPRFAALWQRAVAPLLPVLRLNLAVSPINWKNMHPKVGPVSFFSMLELLPPRVAEELLLAANANTWLADRGSVEVFEKLPALKVPLMLVYATLDPLAPPASGQTFFDALRTKDKRILVLSKANEHFANYNHIDLLFARFGRREVFEPVAKWFAAHPVSAEVADRARASQATATDSPHDKLPVNMKRRKRKSRVESGDAKRAALPKKKTSSTKKARASRKKPAKSRAKKKKPTKRKPGLT